MTVYSCVRVFAACPCAYVLRQSNICTVAGKNCKHVFILIYAIYYGYELSHNMFSFVTHIVSFVSAQTAVYELNKVTL